MTSQDLLIYPKGQSFTIMTAFTHEIVAVTGDASLAIQQAVDTLGEDGGEITLGRGEYPLNQPIKLANKVWLCGKGRASCLVVSQNNQAGIGILCENLDGVVISDLSLQAEDNPGGVAGIVLDACGDSRIRQVFCAGFVQYGIWMRNSSFLCTIESCSLAGNQSANIYLDGLAKGRAGEFIPNLVSDCMIYGGGKGIECNNTIVANILGCCVYQTRDTGFHLHSQSNSIVINGSRTFQVGKYAVLLEDTDEFNLTGNIFCWHIEDGVVVRRANWGTISGNEIIDTGSYNSGVEDFTATWETLPQDLPGYSAVKLYDSRGYTVSGNAIFNWGVAPRMEFGIFENEDCQENLIQGNNINYYDKAAVQTHGKGTIIGENISSRERPHHIRERPLPEFFQTFQTELTDRFIADQLSGSV